MNPEPYIFNGPDYVPERDNPRLKGQIGRVKDLMQDGRWRTLQQIADATGDPPASISAQLRHLRKPRFGSHVVEKQYLGGGLFEYRLLLNENSIAPAPEPVVAPPLVAAGATEQLTLGGGLSG